MKKLLALVFCAGCVSQTAPEPAAVGIVYQLSVFAVIVTLLSVIYYGPPK